MVLVADRVGVAVGEGLMVNVEVAVRVGVAVLLLVPPGPRFARPPPPRVTRSSN